MSLLRQRVEELGALVEKFASERGWVSPGMAFALAAALALAGAVA